jgi:hypothetical protein
VEIWMIFVVVDIDKISIMGRVASFGIDSELWIRNQSLNHYSFVNIYIAVIIIIIIIIIVVIIDSTAVI